MAIIVIITKASVSSLESSCFSTYSGAPQGHHVIFPAKGPPCPLPHIYHCYISYINISLLHPRWDEQCRDTMMTVPPQLTSSLPSFSYPASFRHPPPASSLPQFLAIEFHFVRKGCRGTIKFAFLPQFLAIELHFVRNGCRGTLKIVILHQFLAIEPRFVRKGCVSYRLVGTAPRLKNPGQNFHYRMLGLGAQYKPSGNLCFYTPLCRCAEANRSSRVCSKDFWSILYERFFFKKHVHLQW